MVCIACWGKLCPSSPATAAHRTEQVGKIFPPVVSHAEAVHGAKPLRQRRTELTAPRVVTRATRGSVLYRLLEQTTMLIIGQGRQICRTSGGTFHEDENLVGKFLKKIGTDGVEADQELNTAADPSPHRGSEGPFTERGARSLQEANVSARQIVGSLTS